MSASVGVCLIWSSLKSPPPLGFQPAAYNSIAQATNGEIRRCLSHVLGKPGYLLCLIPPTTEVQVEKKYYITEMMRLNYILSLGILIISNINCTAQFASSSKTKFNRSEIITGADQTEKYLPYLKGKRIGIVANQSSIIGGNSVVDSLLSLGINIIKVFGPEHGFRGNASNGAEVGDERDTKTGILIISLYGRN